MSNTPHEDRFTALMQFAAGDCEVSQEISMSRKVRKLDLVYHFAEQASERLQRLLDDRTLPTLFQEQLMEALMDNQIPQTDTEKESVYQRLRRELREEFQKEGQKEGRKEGREEGRKEGLQEGLQKGLRKGLQKGLQKGRHEGREALLALASRLAPDSLPQLRDIEDLAALEHAVEAAIRESSGK